MGDQRGTRPRQSRAAGETDSGLNHRRTIRAVLRGAQAKFAGSGPGATLDGKEDNAAGTDGLVTSSVTFRNTAKGGTALSARTRGFFEPRFGTDFSGVRIHDDQRAARLARSIGARAFTYRGDIYFNQSEYQPDTASGMRLLAHELTHVVQQGKNDAAAMNGDLPAGGSSSPAEREADLSAANIMAGGLAAPVTQAPTGSIQCDNGEGSGTETEDERFRLRWPGTQPEVFPRLRLAPELQLRLDPEIRARLEATRITEELLDPDTIRSSLLRVDLSTLLATTHPPWLTAPATPAPAPIVPRGSGPATPRAGTGGDVLRAVMAIPAVDSALTRLRTEAADQAGRSWRRLSTGERALVITQSALIAGGALAGLLSSPEGREFGLNLIQNMDIPVPGVPGLTFQLNMTGPDQRILFRLNVGALLPPSLGFR